MFGLQFYGECWSGKHAEERYNMYGESDKCFMELSNPIKTGCDISNENECMGQQNEIYVYRLKGKMVVFQRILMLSTTTTTATATTTVATATAAKKFISPQI